MCDMEYVAVLNNYPEYSLDDNHTVNLSFQITSMPVFDASVSIKCCVGNVRHDMVFILVYYLGVAQIE